jgi:hypothetical protein
MLPVKVQEVDFLLPNLNRGDEGETVAIVNSPKKRYRRERCEKFDRKAPAGTFRVHMITYAADFLRRPSCR